MSYLFLYLNCFGLYFKRRIFINGKLIKITATDKRVEITY